MFAAWFSSHVSDRTLTSSGHLPAWSWTHEHGCRGRRHQEDVSELAAVREEQRSEHPCSALSDRVQVPAATRPPFFHGFAPAPEFAPDEVVGEDRPKRASPRRSPEEHLTAKRAAAQPE